MRVDASRILSHAEIAAIVQHWKRRRRYVHNRQGLAVFRLATCCGLRASEIAGLKLADCRTEGAKPHLRVPKTLGKGQKARSVPLWWDGDTLADLRAWKAEQAIRGASWLICAQSADAWGKQMDRRTVRRVFRRIVSRAVQGREHATTHDGRHTFVSLALASGCSLAEVRDAAGHASTATTSIYTHALPDSGAIRNVFSRKD